MTNDYKDKLLKYMTGNLDNEPKNNTPYFANTTTEEVPNDEYSGTGLKCVDSNGNYNGKSISYGVDGYGKNYINLYDENGTLLKKITKFASGTTLWYVVALNIDEEGNVYGVFNDVQYNGIVNARFVLLNNISEKTINGDYEAVMRNSYFIRTDISYENMNYTSCIGLCKSKQSSNYFMLWYYNGNSVVNQEKIFGIQLTINVGAENDWVDYTPFVIGSDMGSYIDYSYFDIDDTLHVLGYIVSLQSTYIKVFSVTNNDVVLSYSNYASETKPSGFQLESILKQNINKFYILGIGFVRNGSQVTTNAIIYSVENAAFNKVLNKIDTYQSVEAIITSIKCYMDSVNNVPFYCYYMPVTDTTYNIYYGVIPGETDVPFEFEIDNIVDYLDGFSVNNNFNIYTINVYYHISTTYYKDSTKIIYNLQNYNGSDYENKDSLIPRQGILYDDNNNLIFARNLYNYKVYNNRTISVLNVPNTYLNSVTIGQENLLSKTNSTLISNSQNIIKNIYEDLYLNFNNSITMQNRNDSNYVDNMNGAIRLNESVSSINDYDSAKANKIRVNYSDDTSYITSAYNTISDNICTYQIGIHVPNDKNINSIEIISNDEQTTYQKITNLNLENNKYYVITQDVHVV